jgi:integrase
MPRRPKEPRYFPSRKGYFVQIGKVQHLLAKGDKNDPAVIEEAWNKFHALMHVNSSLVEGDRSTVYALTQKYLAWAGVYLKDSTQAIKKKFLMAFEEKWGTLRVCDLKRMHLTEWLTERSVPKFNARLGKMCRWGQSTRNIAIMTVQSMFNWAAEEGVISKNPLGKVKREAEVSRGLQCMVTDEQHMLMMERQTEVSRRDSYRNILTVLYHTGARPGEICHMEARHYNPQMRAWVIDSTEASGNNKLGVHGKRRIILLNGELVKLVEGLNARFPKGPIFPNRHGECYSAAQMSMRFRKNRDAINARFEREGKPKPFPPEVTPYGYRHRFVTEWLESGKPVGVLAGLLGTSIGMINKHYSHLSDMAESMRRELLNFRTGAAGGETAEKPGPSASPADDKAAS